MPLLQYPPDMHGKWSTPNVHHMPLSIYSGVGLALRVYNSKSSTFGDHSSADGIYWLPTRSVIEFQHICSCQAQTSNNTKFELHSFNRYSNLMWKPNLCPVSESTRFWGNRERQYVDIRSGENPFPAMIISPWIWHETTDDWIALLLVLAIAGKQYGINIMCKCAHGCTDAWLTKPLKRKVQKIVSGFVALLPCQVCVCVCAWVHCTCSISPILLAQHAAVNRHYIANVTHFACTSMVCPHKYFHVGSA